MLFSFSMSEASLTDVKATHFVDFFFICVRYAVCDRCFSVTGRIIKYWCINIYSVLAFLQLDCSHTKFPNQTITISKPHKHHLHKQALSPNPISRNHKHHLQTKLFQSLLHIHLFSRKDNRCRNN